MTRLAKFNLAKAELLTVLNLRPSSTTELEYIVEEAESRFTQEQLEEMLEVIGEVLGRPEAPEPEENGEEMDVEG